MCMVSFFPFLWFFPPRQPRTLGLLLWFRYGTPVLTFVIFLLSPFYSSIFSLFFWYQEGFSCRLQRTGERVTVPRADANARVFVDASSNVRLDPLQGRRLKQLGRRRRPLFFFFALRLVYPFPIFSSDLIPPSGFSSFLSSPHPNNNKITTKQAAPWCWLACGL